MKPEMSFIFPTHTEQTLSAAPAKGCSGFDKPNAQIITIHYSASEQENKSRTSTKGDADPPRYYKEPQRFE